MNFLHNAFTTDLGSDFVALNAQGTPIGRASSKEALEQAHAGADVRILDAAELAKLTPTLAEAATASLDGPFAAVVAQGVKDPDGNEPLDAAPANAENAFAAPGKKTGTEDTPKVDPLDHDADGKKGGNVLNKDKVAADKKAKASK